jgi:hypothetical protein
MMRHNDPYLNDDASARADESAVRVLFDTTAPEADPMRVERLAARAVDAAAHPSAARWPWVGGLLALGMAALVFLMLSPPPIEDQVGPGEPIAVLSADAGAEPPTMPGSATAAEPDGHLDIRPERFDWDWDDHDLLLDEGDDVTAGLDLLAGPTSLEDVEETDEAWEQILRAAPAKPHRPI